MALENRWHLRRVADSMSKACFVCYRPTPNVLITPDNKDFFYICTGHLTDRGFCSPIVDPDAEAAKAARKKKEELEREIEKVKKEYEENQKRKKEKKKAKAEESREKGKGKDAAENVADDHDNDLDQERDAKIKSLQSQGEGNKEEADIPRIFALHKQFYQMRLDRLRNMEVAKKNRERLRDPTTFPTVPKGDI